MLTQLQVEDQNNVTLGQESTVSSIAQVTSKENIISTSHHFTLLN